MESVHRGLVPGFLGEGFLRATMRKYGLDVEMFNPLREGLESTALSPGEVLLRNPMRKWEIVSSLQKSIRRGNKVDALRAASALLSVNDPEMTRYLWKRVCTTAAEDIGLGDPLLVAFTLLCAETFTPTKFSKAQRPVLYFLVDRLCSSAKDRTLCDMAIIDSCWVRSKNKENTTAQLSEDELCYAMATQECGKYPPEGSLFSYLQAQKWRTEDMAKFFPVGALLSSDGVTIKKVPMTDYTVLTSLPSYAYDMHTQIGKKAIGYLLGSTKVKAFFDTLQVADRGKAVGWALFYAEGGNLDAQIDYDGRESLYSAAINISLLDLGVPKDRIVQLIALVSESLSLLDTYRQKILGVSYAK